MWPAFTRRRQLIVESSQGFPREATQNALRLVHSAANYERLAVNLSAKTEYACIAVLELAANYGTGIVYPNTLLDAGQLQPNDFHETSNRQSLKQSSQSANERARHDAAILDLLNDWTVAPRDTRLMRTL